MRAFFSFIALAIAVTALSPTPALGQDACNKIASDWDALERNLAQNEADMAQEDSAARASVLATQNQTIYTKAEALASAAQRLKCSKVYITPDPQPFKSSAKVCTGLKKINRLIDKYSRNTDASKKYEPNCDQSIWQPAIYN
jgi:hypothetical protein